MTKVEITSRATDGGEADSAKVYIGDKLCGAFPAAVESSKKYVFDCNVAGDYVKVVTGLNDSTQKLGFSTIEVHNQYNPIGDGNVLDDVMKCQQYC